LTHSASWLDTGGYTSLSVLTMTFIGSTAPR